MCQHYFCQHKWLIIILHFTPLTALKAAIFPGQGENTEPRGKATGNYSDKKKGLPFVNRQPLVSDVF